MRFHPTSFFQLTLLCFVFFFIFSCNKDYDLLAEAVLPDSENTNVEDQDSTEADKEYEVKTFAFSPIDDAYIQDSKGFDQSIMRLEENNRTGYLMFDLSVIIGNITDVDLEFTVESDRGDGTIDIYKGVNNEWTEEELTQDSAPVIDIPLGTITKTFELQSTEKVKLSASDIQPEKTTIIMTHKVGNDLAIASKENASKSGPKLIVTYKAPIGTEDIVDTSPEEILPDEPVESTDVIDNINLSEDVIYWKNLFDRTWSSDFSKAIVQSKSGNPYQEYYHMSYPLDGLIQVWQATGDNTYLDNALVLIENTINDAKPMEGANTGYLGWASDLTKTDVTRNTEGTSLWEAYMFRHVASLLRIMYQSPNLRASGSYQARYDAILAFTEKNIFDKWYNRSSNKSDIYRSRTHIVAHWARIGMELYIITGKQKYKEVFDNISFNGMPNWSGASIRSRMHNNSKVAGAYSLYQTWDSNTVQDTSHGADVISFLVIAHENGMYWDTNDMAGLVKMLDKVIWTSNSPLQFTANFDGSGGSNKSDAGFHGMITLGRFSQTLQNRIKAYYNASSVSYQEAQAMGIAALNSKILADGKPVYPENY